MLGAIKAQDLDIVIGSRHAAGGGIGEWDRRRVTISGIACFLARVVIPADLTDPMSGFFLISRPAFERAVRRLSGHGFKILVDLFASSPYHSGSPRSDTNFASDYMGKVNSTVLSPGNT